MYDDDELNDEMSKEEVIIEELSSDLRSVEEKVVELRRELENEEKNYEVLKGRFENLMSMIGVGRILVGRFSPFFIC